MSLSASWAPGLVFVGDAGPGNEGVHTHVHAAARVLRQTVCCAHPLTPLSTPRTVTTVRFICLETVCGDCLSISSACCFYLNLPSPPPTRTDGGALLLCVLALCRLISSPYYPTHKHTHEQMSPENPTPNNNDNARPSW